MAFPSLSSSDVCTLQILVRPSDIWLFGEGEMKKEQAGGKRDSLGGGQKREG